MLLLLVVVVVRCCHGGLFRMPPQLPLAPSHRTARTPLPPKARRLRRLKELELEDEAALLRQNQSDEKRRQQQQREQQRQQQQHKKPDGSADAPGLAAWLTRKLGFGGGGQAAAPAPPPLTPQQRAHLAAQARRARVARELGAGPAPPAAPRGLYVHGSVGSGKSALMDMFFEAATGGGGGGTEAVGGADAQAGSGKKQPALEFARRLHFNAAMLDLHSRLHLLDLRREARDHEHGTVAAVAAAAAEGHNDPGSAQHGKQGAGAGSSQARVSAAVLDRALELGEELEGGGGGARSSSGGSSSGGDAAAAAAAAGGDGAGGDTLSDSQVARWFDVESKKQKEAKAAVLAVRRHLRCVLLLCWRRS
jgi:hypothetical protein